MTKNDTYINNIPLLSIVIDNQLIIKNVNEIFIQLVNTKESEIVGSKLQSYPFPNLIQYFEHAEILKDRDLKIVDSFTLNNSKKTFQFLVKAIDSNQKFIILGIDISKDIFRKEIEDLSRRQQEENARYKLISQIASGVAHEINNPLAIITGFLSSMKNKIIRGSENNDYEFFQDRILKISNSVDRISMIVRGLKFLSKSDLNSPFIQFSIDDIIKNALDLCNEKFKSSGIEVVVENQISNELINCRPIQLTQALLNLLLNSHDALEKLDTKWIKIICRKDSSNIFISIIDSGEGISNNLQDKIMQPFFSTKDENKNIGLGLSTSKMILQDHSGTLVYDPTSANTKFDLIFNLS